MQHSTTAVLFVFALSSSRAWAQVIPNDDCIGATPIAGLGTFDFDTQNATTGAGVDNDNAVCDVTSFSVSFLTEQDVWFSWTAPATSRYSVDTLAGATFDTKLGVYPAGCPATGALACNNDYGTSLQSRLTFDAIAGASYLIQLGSPVPGMEGMGVFEIDDLGPAVPVGTVYCMSFMNSSGAAATLAATGSASVMAETLRLTTTSAPASATGIFFFGSTQISVPFGGGLRCAGGAIRRLPIHRATAGGVFVETEVWASVNSAVLVPGSTWNFQTWFREPTSPLGVGFNTSDAVAITFLP